MIDMVIGVGWLLSHGVLAAKFRISLGGYLPPMKPGDAGNLSESIMADCHASRAEVLHGNFLTDMIGRNP